MGGGEECRNVYRREISALSKGWWVSQFQTAMGSKRWSAASASSVPGSVKSFQGRRGYLGPVISCIPCGKRESGFATLRNCKLHKVKKQNINRRSAQRMALASEHSFALVPRPHREARACIERLAPRSAQELEVAAGGQKGPETLSIRACLKSLRTVASLDRVIPRITIRTPPARYRRESGQMRN